VSEDKADRFRPPLYEPEADHQSEPEEGEPLPGMTQEPWPSEPDEGGIAPPGEDGQEEEGPPPGDTPQAEPVHAEPPEEQQPAAPEEPAEGEELPEQSGPPAGLDGGTDYSTWTTVELKDEVRRRNSTFSEGDRLPIDRNKAELIEILQADDAKQQ
jgi:hypothetical protein